MVEQQEQVAVESPAMKARFMCAAEFDVDPQEFEAALRKAHRAGNFRQCDVPVVVDGGRYGDARAITEVVVFFPEDSQVAAMTKARELFEALLMAALTEMVAPARLPQARAFECCETFRGPR